MTNPHTSDILNGEPLSSVQKAHLKNMYPTITDADLAGTRSAARTAVTSRIGIPDAQFNTLIAGKFFV